MRGAFQLLTRSRKFIGSTRDVAVAVFTAAILVNVLQFNFIPDKKRYNPLSKYDTADITKITTSSADLKARYGLFFELGRRYPGSNIILPKGSGVRFEQPLLSYGRARHVASATYDATAVLSGVEYESFIVAHGKGGPKGAPFVIAAGSNPKVFLVARRQGKTILLDLSLLLNARSPSRD